MKGYEIRKVYVIICAKCNEDITRAQSGEEPSTRAGADEYAREHEKIFHPAVPEADSAADTAAASWADWD